MGGEPLQSILNIKFVMKVAIRKARSVNKDNIFEVFLFGSGRFEYQVLKEAGEAFPSSLYIDQVLQKGQHFHCIETIILLLHSPIHYQVDFNCLNTNFCFLYVFTDVPVDKRRFSSGVISYNHNHEFPLRCHY